jgi:hypothetical protein
MEFVLGAFLGTFVTILTFSAFHYPHANSNSRLSNTWHGDTQSDRNSKITG